MRPNEKLVSMSLKIAKERDWMELTKLVSLLMGLGSLTGTKPSQVMYNTYLVASTRSPTIYCCRNKSPYGRWLGQVPPPQGINPLYYGPYAFYHPI